MSENLAVNVAEIIQSFGQDGPLHVFDFTLDQMKPGFSAEAEAQLRQLTQNSFAFLHHSSPKGLATVAYYDYLASRIAFFSAERQRSIHQPRFSSTPAFRVKNELEALIRNKENIIEATRGVMESDRTYRRSPVHYISSLASCMNQYAQASYYGFLSSDHLMKIPDAVLSGAAHFVYRVVEKSGIAVDSSNPLAIVYTSDGLVPQALGAGVFIPRSAPLLVEALNNQGIKTNPIREGAFLVSFRGLNNKEHHYILSADAAPAEIDHVVGRIRFVGAVNFLEIQPADSNINFESRPLKQIIAQANPTDSPRESYHNFNYLIEHLKGNMSEALVQALGGLCHVIPVQTEDGNFFLEQFSTIEESNGSMQSYLGVASLSQGTKRKWTPAELLNYFQSVIDITGNGGNQAQINQSDHSSSLREVFEGCKNLAQKNIKKIKTRGSMDLGPSDISDLLTVGSSFLSYQWNGGNETQNQGSDSFSFIKKTLDLGSSYFGKSFDITCPLKQMVYRQPSFRSRGFGQQRIFPRQTFRVV